MIGSEHTQQHLPKDLKLKTENDTYASWEALSILPNVSRLDGSSAVTELPKIGATSSRDGGTQMREVHRATLSPKCSYIGETRNQSRGHRCIAENATAGKMKGFFVFNHRGESRQDRKEWRYLGHMSQGRRHESEITDHNVAPSTQRRTAARH